MQKQKWLFSLALSACCIAMPLAGCQVLHNVQSNVPDAEYFHDYMVRDLRSYFKLERGSATSITYELIEDGPYGGGVSFPHYCAWIYIYDGNKVLQQGVAAVDAVKKQGFGVTKFISKDEIRKDPKALEQIFPPLLCPEIVARANRAK